jgi:hypothetical protein
MKSKTPANQVLIGLRREIEKENGSKAARTRFGAARTGLGKGATFVPGAWRVLNWLSKMSAGKGSFFSGS